MFREKIQKLLTARIREIVLYTAGCGCSLILKICLAVFINHIGVSFWCAYFITHTILLFSSFFYHHCITFRKKFEGLRKTVNDFIEFTAAVIALKAVDYLLVNIGIELLNKYFVPENASLYVRQLLNAGTIFCISGFIFVLRYFIYRVLFRKPALEYYTGSMIRQVYLAHASNHEIAGNAASGGVVTGLLVSMLEQRKIDGALVAVSDFSKNADQRFHTIIAKSVQDLRRSQGSIYCDFRFLTPELIEQLRSFQGRLAVVGIPCQLKQIDGICNKYPEISEKIVLKIGLFCGHTSKPELLDHVLKKKGIDQGLIKSFRFRCGSWRGKAKAEMSNGDIVQWPTAFYNLYQNLFVAAPSRCINCFDHFAEEADISTGDVWCQKYRFAKIKPSMTALRTEIGEKYFTEALQSGDLIAERKTIKDLYNANSRSVVFHKAIAAKATVFSKYGINIPVPEGARPARWNEKLAAEIIAFFYRKDTKDVLKMNRRFLKLCLYVMKGLTSF